MPRIMAPYRTAFPIVTSIMKNGNCTLKTPATSVRGSPMTGSQANKSDHFPYFLKCKVARVICSFLKGNQGRSSKRHRLRPSHQFRVEPQTLPVVAARKSNQGTPLPFCKRAASAISEKAGNSVAAMKAFQKRPA